MADLAAVFAALKPLLEKHAGAMFVARDKPDDYYLETKSHSNRGRRMFFGAVQIRKSYVTFHLIPVYCSAVLRARLSPELKKRMQGKSCFNFTRVDVELIRELGAITDAGFEGFRSAGWL